MTAEDILFDLVRVNLAGSAAIAMVLLLRRFVLIGIGAKAAYRLWLVVPIAAAACFLPARERVMLQPLPVFAAAPEASVETGEEATPVARAAVSPLAPSPESVVPPSLADALLAVWLLVGAGLLAHSVARTRRLSKDPSVGPALVGVLRPKLILPADFETRFGAQERALILAHEEVHRASGHTLVNALVEVARCLCWFNPLAHNAAVGIRTDQELSCDAAVITAHPDERRAYGEALLKTQIACGHLPLGCTWPSRTSKRLKERIEMLAQPAPARWQAMVGAAVVAAVGGGLGYAAWAQQPPVIASPTAVWTPSAEAPAGLLTPLEVQRHDFFIELAEAGSPCPGAARSECLPGTGIDIVFFGTTSTEMWWWPDRGVDVWSEAFGSRKAVNFGSQGTNPASLLWRMQNGELDGYRAKIIVLAAFCCIDRRVDRDRVEELIASYEPILAEIRARQPQAKVLIFADFPRGGLSLEAWREDAAANAQAHAPLIDNETVFWVDIGERFYHPDGTYDQSMWSPDFHSRGIQAPAFQAWTEELEPWLDRFVG